MGYEHYWQRPLVLDSVRFAAWSRDVRRVVKALPRGIICNSGGDGEPIISPTLVALNGNRTTYVWRDTWIGNNDSLMTDANMPFIVEQTLTDSSRWWIRDHPDTHGWLHDACKTRDKPYDIVVTAALILLVHYFPDKCKASTDGETDNWQPGRDLVRFATGMPFDVTVDEMSWVHIKASPNRRLNT